jgi:hypothetical protein
VHCSIPFSSFERGYFCIKIPVLLSVLLAMPTGAHHPAIHHSQPSHHPAVGRQQHVARGMHSDGCVGAERANATPARTALLAFAEARMDTCSDFAWTDLVRYENQ